MGAGFNSSRPDNFMLDKEDQIMYPNKELDKSDPLREQIEIQVEEMIWLNEDD